MASFLRVQNVSKAFRQSDQSIPVLSGLSLELNEGESLSIVGQSGVGKSTLLHCLGLLDSIDQGEIYFGSERVAQAGTKPSQKSGVLQRRRQIGFVFQFHYLMAELSALENVMVPLMLNCQEADSAFGRAKAFLERVGLGHRLDHRPSQLSGGEQQRVAIARALVHEPKIILADEPTGNLDPKTAEQVFSVLKEQSLSLKAILVMATHNLELARFLGRKATLIEGRLQE